MAAQPAAVTLVYRLTWGRYLHTDGWFLSTDDSLDSTRAANRLHAAGIDYRLIPGVEGKTWFVPVRVRRSAGSVRQAVVAALTG